MLVALYHGDHKKDGLKARLGYALIRLGQIAEVYGNYTHCEAILGGTWRSAEIASASVRDGNQVRVRTTELNPGHWTILDVPSSDVNTCRAWFTARQGVTYSMVGAVSSALWFARFLLHLKGVRIAGLGYWCSRAVAESMGLSGSEDMSVAEFVSVIWNLPGTRDVTREFFQQNT